MTDEDLEAANALVVLSAQPSPTHTGSPVEADEDESVSEAPPSGRDSTLDEDPTDSPSSALSRDLATSRVQFPCPQVHSPETKPTSSGGTQSVEGSATSQKSLRIRLRFGTKAQKESTPKFKLLSLIPRVSPARETGPLFERVYGHQNRAKSEPRRETASFTLLGGEHTARKDLRRLAPTNDFSTGYKGAKRIRHDPSPTTDTDVRMKKNSSKMSYFEISQRCATESASMLPGRPATREVSAGIDVLHIDDQASEGAQTSDLINGITPSRDDAVTDEDIAKEVSGEILMHNQRITEFLARRSRPDYTDAEVHQFQRDWVQSYCNKRRDEGHLKQFHCSNHLLTGAPCDTAQEYGAMSLARAGISHYFGHNKTEWLQVPNRYRIVLCRKHYQTGAYRGRKHTLPGDEDSYEMLQLKLIKTQITRLEMWRPNAKFLVKPTVASCKRLAAYYKLLAQGRDISEASSEINSTRSGKEPRAEEKVNVEFAVQFDNMYGKDEQSVEDLLGAVTYIEQQLRASVIQHIPAVEFLLATNGKDHVRVLQFARRWNDRAAEKLKLPVELSAKQRVSRVKGEKDTENQDVKSNVLKRKAGTEVESRNEIAMKKTKRD